MNTHHTCQASPDELGILPFEDDYSDEELELLDEIDDPDWREAVREKCLLRRDLQQPDLEREERLTLLEVLSGVRSRLTDIRSIYYQAGVLRVQRGETQ